MFYDIYTDIGGVVEAAIFSNLGIDSVVAAVIELDGSKFTGSNIIIKMYFL